MPTSPTDNTGTAGSQYGTGNPYYGSGFTNFDRYLQDTNLDWGAKQNALVPASNDWSMQTPFDNWMINRAHPEGLAVVQDPGSDTPTRPPGPQDGRQPANLPSDKPFVPNPNAPAAGPAQPRPGPSRNPETPQPPPNTITTHVNDPRVPGGYDKSYNTNDPRLPADQRKTTPTATAPAANLQLEQSAWPMLDKKLETGAW